MEPIQILKVVFIVHIGLLPIAFFRLIICRMMDQYSKIDSSSLFYKFLPRWALAALNFIIAGNFIPLIITGTFLKIFSTSTNHRFGSEATASNKSSI